MLVLYKDSYNSSVINSQSAFSQKLSKLYPFLDKIPLVFYKKRSKAVFSTSWVPSWKLIKFINEFNPDIVHLHWICSGMISIRDISKIKAPLVWSLHDMWPFTGGCHYSNSCISYQKACGNCQALNSKTTKDISYRILKLKKKKYDTISNFSIIGLSRWIANCAKNSILFRDRKVYNLPNPIDTKLFSPIDKSVARELMGFPKDKKLILFGACDGTTDLRKGYKELCLALNKIQRDDIELNVLGSSCSDDLKLNVRCIGYLHDQISLKIVYNAVDIVIIPSLQENLSNMIMESLSCGTPVVAFDIGGNSDMIEHCKNGYLAKPYDPEDLAKGIEWILNCSNYSELQQNARNKVVSEFDSNVVARKYIDLYKNILQN